jgi:tetratricopeptide (TPR) repeat protein
MPADLGEGDDCRAFHGQMHGHSAISRLALLLAALTTFQTVQLRAFGPQGVKPGTVVVQIGAELALYNAEAGPTHRQLRGIRTYRVEEDNGAWARVRATSGSISGWVRSSDLLGVDEAIQFFTQRLKHPDCDWFPYVMRSFCYRHKGKLDSALSDLDDGLRRFPTQALLYSQRAVVFIAKHELGKALDDMNSCLELEPTDEHLCQRAGVLIDLGQPDDAIDDLNSAIEMNPSRSIAYYRRANANRLLGRFPQAEEDCASALKLNPAYFEAHNMVGACWNERGDYRKAISAFDRALRLSSSYPAAYNNRGWARMNLKEYEQAIEDFDSAIRYDPAFALAYVNRACTWLFKDSYDRALADATAAIRLQPDLSEAYHRRGEALFYKEDCVEAKKDYKRAIELDKGKACACSDLAWVLATCPTAECRDGKAAIELAQDACELSGWRDSQYLSGLAVAYAESGNFASAVMWQLEAMKQQREGDSQADRSRNDSVLKTLRSGQPYRHSHRSVE